MHVSKREFEAKYFRNMLREVGDGPKTAILTVKGLKKFVVAEFEMFVEYLKYMIASKAKAAKGNLFAQSLHDGGTLANKKKYQALGLQFVDEKWRKNWVICVALTRCMDGTDSMVASPATEA